jgi:hypothetical protein
MIIPTASLTIHQNLTSDLTSGRRLPLPLVQDQPVHTDEELEPLKEFNSPENVEKLTSLRSQLAERATLVQKGLFDLDLPLFLTTVDCIFDPLPTSLVQLPTPISAAPSILLTPPSLFEHITKLQGRLNKARYELALLPRCQPHHDTEDTESTDHQIVKERKHLHHQ